MEKNLENIKQKSFLIPLSCYFNIYVESHTSRTHELSSFFLMSTKMKGLKYIFHDSTVFPPPSLSFDEREKCKILLRLMLITRFPRLGGRTLLLVCVFSRGFSISRASQECRRKEFISVASCLLVISSVNRILIPFHEKIYDCDEHKKLSNDVLLFTLHLLYSLCCRSRSCLSVFFGRWKMEKSFNSSQMKWNTYTLTYIMCNYQSWNSSTLLHLHSG